MELQVYQLAENLHMTVTDIKTKMPVSELMGWIAFHGEKHRKQQAKDGNLLAMDENQIVGAFTNG
jgi:hypothetical protein